LRELRNCDSIPPVLAATPLDGITQRTRVTSVTSGGRLGLLVVFGQGVVSFPLPESGELSLGRATDSDLRVDDDSLSRRHASLQIDEGAVSVRDLGSQNGTRLNGRPVGGEWVPFALGDALQLGEVTAVLQRTEAARAQRRLWTHDYFEARLEEECAKGSGAFAVIRVHFENGGPLQLEAAGALSRVLQPGDVLASYGAGELEVLLTGVTEAQVPDRADALVAALEPLGAAVRTGAACFPRDGRDADRLLARACAEAFKPARPTGKAGHPARPVVEAPAMRRLYDMVARVAAGDISVLVLGETGVGKEVVARALHERSARAKKPYLALNCGAFAESLLESELFGHEKGAFTGASEARAGLFEATEGGTVFLDEIGELPPSTQVKLLRVLEEKAVRRVGSNKSRPIDVRFVAATHRDLEAEVKAGRFREDLYYRISGVTLAVPPLRQRPEELMPLVGLFSDQAAAQLGRRPPAVSAQAQRQLEAYAWPGNIRELKNVIERAVLLADELLDTQHLPLEKMAATWLDATPAPLPEPAPLPQAEARADRERIEKALTECAGNQTQAARLLGISRRTLVHRLDEYALPRPKKKAR